MHLNFVSVTTAQSSFFLVPYTDESVVMWYFCFQQDLEAFFQLVIVLAYLREKKWSAHGLKFILGLCCRGKSG